MSVFLSVLIFSVSSNENRDNGTWITFIGVCIEYVIGFSLCYVSAYLVLKESEVILPRQLYKLVCFWICGKNMFGEGNLDDASTDMSKDITSGMGVCVAIVCCTSAV